MGQLSLVIVDNGSAPEQQAWLGQWGDGHDARVVLLDTNVGCPRALNLALSFRRPGQPVIKIDNDVRVVSPAWVMGIERLVTYWQTRNRNVAMVSAYYEPWQEQRVRGREVFEGQTVWHIAPVVGHAVYHTAAFMDHVGYFDVLSDDHLYGFEDLIMSHKASELAWETVAWEGWKIENIQRVSALGREGRDAHVAAMRSLYNDRVRMLNLGGPLYTGCDGLPTHRGA